MAPTIAVGAVSRRSLVVDLAQRGEQVDQGVRVGLCGDVSQLDQVDSRADGHRPVRVDHRQRGTMNGGRDGGSRAAAGPGALAAALVDRGLLDLAVDLPTLGPAALDRPSEASRRGPVRYQLVTEISPTKCTMAGCASAGTEAGAPPTSPPR